MPAYENLNTWSDPEDKGHIESECMWCHEFKNLLDQVWHITAGRPEDCPQTEQKQLSKLGKKKNQLSDSELEYTWFILAWNQTNTRHT